MALVFFLIGIRKVRFLSAHDKSLYWLRACAADRQPEEQASRQPECGGNGQEAMLRPQHLEAAGSCWSQLAVTHMMTDAGQYCLHHTTTAANPT
jgi:hypothetical protein